LKYHIGQKYETSGKVKWHSSFINIGLTLQNYTFKKPKTPIEGAFRKNSLLKGETIHPQRERRIAYSMCYFLKLICEIGKAVEQKLIKQNNSMKKRALSHRN